MSTPDSIPWFEPLLDNADVEAVRSVVASGFVNEGPQNRAFEALLQDYFDVPHAVTTPSGTMAIALALMAHGIGPGDAVIVPAMTFIGTASAVRLTGADVLLADVSPDTFVLDLQDVERKWTNSVKAVVPVHLTGRAVDMTRLNEWAHNKGCIVIEDAAEALASRNESGWLGAQGHAGCFSFAPTKIITAGQGGFVLTRNTATRDQLTRLRDHGRLSRSSDVHPVTGYNFKVTDMQIALVRSQWNKLEARIRRMKEIDRIYQGTLEGCPHIRWPDRPAQGYLMWPDIKTPFRDGMVTALKQQGIHLRPYWPALHLQPAYENGLSFPGAEEACRQACWLPCSPAITDDQIQQVARAIRAYLEAQ